jgi:O-antigen/teichoic acid export membrane protein
VISFLKHAAVASLGTLVGQLLAILGYFLSARIYGPQAFGVFATFLAAISLGAILSTGATETTLVRLSNTDDRRSQMALIISTSFLMSFLFAIITVIVLSIFPSFLDVNRVVFCFAIFLGTFTLATATTCQTFSATEGNFNTLTKMRICQSAATALLPIGLSVTGHNGGQMIVGYVLGLLLSSFIWYLVLKPPHLKVASWSHILGFVRREKNCYRVVLPALLVGSVTSAIPQFVVNGRFGASEAGYLALTFRVLAAPTSLIGAAIRDVFNRYASQAYQNNGNCYREYVATLVLLSAVALPYAAVIWYFGEDLFVIVFGGKWQMSGVYAGILAPVFAISIVAAPLTYIVYIVGRQIFDLYWQVALLTAAITAYASSESLPASLSAYTYAAAMLYASYILYGIYLSLGQHQTKQRVD